MQIHRHNDAGDIFGGLKNDACTNAQPPAREPRRAHLLAEFQQAIVKRFNAAVAKRDARRFAAQTAAMLKPPPAHNAPGKRLRIKNEYRTVQVPGGGGTPAADMELKSVGQQASDVGVQDKPAVPDTRRTIDGSRAK